MQQSSTNPTYSFGYVGNYVLIENKNGMRVQLPMLLIKEIVKQMENDKV